MRGVAFKRFRHGRGRERRNQWFEPVPADGGADAEADTEADPGADGSKGAAGNMHATAGRPQKRFGYGNVYSQYEGGFQCVPFLSLRPAYRDRNLKRVVSRRRRLDRGPYVRVRYGARHGEDSSTVTFFYTLLGDHYQGTPVTARELLYANGDKYTVLAAGGGAIEQCERSPQGAGCLCKCRIALF
jgi:hypothetical protein